MKKIFTLLVGVIFSSAIFCQPAIQWQKSLGGIGREEAHHIKQTFDGGYIIAGISGSNDGDVTGHHGNPSVDDFWIVKLDSIGTIEWQKSLGGTLNEYAWEVTQTSDSGYIVAGGSQSNDGDVTLNQGQWDAWIVKLDALGNIQWQKSFGGTLTEYAFAIKQVNDGGYIIGGLARSNDGDVSGNNSVTGAADAWIIKLNSTGVMQWQKCLGGTYNEEVYSIQQTTDGGYIAGGSAQSNDGDLTLHHGPATYEDYWIIKLDSIGNIQWQKVYGGTRQDEIYSIQQTTDGGYIVAGYAVSTDDDVIGNHAFSLPDYWVLKLNSAGNVEWKKCYGGNRYDYAYSIQQTADGGYIMAGESTSDIGDMTVHYGPSYESDYWIVKIDSAGIIEWQKTIGGTESDWGASIMETTDGGYIVAGHSNSNDIDVTGHHGPNYQSDYWVVKLMPCTPLSLTTTFASPACYGGTSSTTVTPINGNPPFSYLWSNGDTTSTVILSAGNYSVTVTAANSCTESATVSITQPPQLTDSLSSIATDASCVGSATVVANGGTPPYQYQWSNSAVTPTINNLCSGWYHITITDANDCVVTDSVFVNLTSGINNINYSHIILFSPNPATTELRIKNAEFGIERVEIYDVLGSRVIASPLNPLKGTSASIDVSSLAPGIYFVKVRGEKEERVAKFVKQ